MLGKHFSLGFSYVGWLYETGNAPIKYRYSMQNIMAAITWYPNTLRTSVTSRTTRGSSSTVRIFSFIPLCILLYC